VHRKIARLVDILLEETERRGYTIHKEQTGGYNNRAIRKSNPKKPSNHSWGLAVDINSIINEFRTDGKLVTDVPVWMPKLWNKYGFAWGGAYKHNRKDPMHFEFMGSPADADDKTQAAIKQLSLGGQVRTNIPRAAVHKYTVREGDTLSGIAARLHTRGGWPALYKLNRATIGPNPGAIFPGQVLRLP
jgi:LysM repeat protein